MVGPPLGSPETPEGRRVSIESRQPPAASLLPAVPKYAAVVVHGMGQQTKFETLDVLAHGSRVPPACPRWPPRGPVGRRRRARWLHRLELSLRTDGGRRELHVYEAYWAPLTEGAGHACATSSTSCFAPSRTASERTSEFHRWLFGQSYQVSRPRFEPSSGCSSASPPSSSLVVINLTIALVAGARWAIGACARTSSATGCTAICPRCSTCSSSSWWPSRSSCSCSGSGRRARRAGSPGSSASWPSDCLFAGRGRHHRRSAWPFLLPVYLHRRGAAPSTPAAAARRVSVSGRGRASTTAVGSACWPSRSRPWPSPSSWGSSSGAAQACPARFRSGESAQGPHAAGRRPGLRPDGGLSWRRRSGSA